MARRKSTLAELFWRKVDKSGPVPASPEAEGNCWLWTGSRNSAGYGQQHIVKPGDKKALAMAHRVSYELSVGPIPAGRQVNHHCDVRACVRPSHLYAGTHQENTADMVRRKRYSMPNAVLSDADVTWLRQNPEAELTKIAERTGVGVSTLSQAATGTTYKHVQTPPRRKATPGSGSKLTEEQVRFILESPLRGVDLAIDHGFQQSLTSSVRRGNLYRDVTERLGLTHLLRRAYADAGKLSDQQVAELRASELSGKELAAKFGLSRGAVSMIRSGQRR